MSQRKILLVEDAYDMQLIIRASLQNHFVVTCTDSIKSAEAALKEQTFDLLLLDIEFPESGSGFELCSSLRAQERYRNMPIVFLSGKADADDKVYGFSIGADDYIVKPPEPKELLARIEARLKNKNIDMLKRGIFRLDFNVQKVYRNEQGAEKELSLTPIEFKIVSYLARSEGLVVPREQLLKNVWGEAVHVSAHTLDTHISSLRKKMGDRGNYIKSVTRKGYFFDSQAA